MTLAQPQSRFGRQNENLDRIGAGYPQPDDLVIELAEARGRAGVEPQRAIDCRFDQRCEG